MTAPTLTLLKIGGNVLNHEETLSRVLNRFSRLPGPKILVHGGGRTATELAHRLDLPQRMIEGRRVTDEQTLRIAIMVYGGLINKSLVAALQGLGSKAIGMTGADLDLIRARKRPAEPIDFGFVGDVTSVRAEELLPLLEQGAVPVIAPLSHDGAGTLLNTNADTIAQELACSLSSEYAVKLVYSFEKPGVLADLNSPESLIRKMTKKEFDHYRAQGAISDGMIPKLENAFRALDRGVREVIIGPADLLENLLRGETGTRCVHET
jgi:acetylglutamate kinase